MAPWEIAAALGDESLPHFLRDVDVYMDRPPTSKARGICRYYATQRGCFAADSCKFLHGPDEKLTPYDKAKACKYYARGHCNRGDQCWFRHDRPKLAPDDERARFSAESCCICLEKPITYGLLIDCSHVFCLECIRQWRAPAGKSPDVVSSGTIKSCPLCRTPSRFVTPSAHFFPHDSPRKKETIDAYKASMARVSCKYFEETSRTGKPCCPFGLDCFYQHINPDGTPHVFRHGAKHSMLAYRRHRVRNTNFLSARLDSEDPIEFLQQIFENPITNLHATLDVIRASLPALMERFASSNDVESHDSGEDEEAMNDFIGESFESLEGVNEAALTPPATLEGVQSMPANLTPDYTLPTQTPHLPETPVASRPTPSLLFGSLPAYPSFQFGTATGAQARQTFIIDISDDDEDDENEDEEGPDSQTRDAGPNNAIESSDSPRSASPPVTRSPSEQSTTGPPVVGRTYTNMSLSRAQCEHDVDPPFLTDGRGRVVWSSTRNASTRGLAVDARALRHSRTGSASRVACPSPGPTHLVSSIRGHAWGGQDAQDVYEKVGGGEESGDMD